MDSEEFRIRGKELVDFIADYNENVRKLPVLSNVDEGYMRAYIPNKAPNEAQSFQSVMKDFKEVVMKGMTHWHSPKFFAYFPAGQSYASICADMLSDCLGCIGFSWFRKRGKELIDFIADYNDNIRDYPVLSQVESGFMKPFVAQEAPEEGESFDNVLKDVKGVVMEGVTHWHSPKFFAYFPTGQSYASICADMISNCIGCVGFTWISSPACTELEVLMMDWLCSMLKLPEFFKSSSKTGGGVIQGTASEATFICLLAARSKVCNKINVHDKNHKLVMYTSQEAHCSVERASLLASVIIRKIPTNDDFSMNAQLLLQTIGQDLEQGLIPFYIVATIGTTAVCAFDNLTDIGKIAKEFDLWMHIDAAYAGTSFVCPEYRYLMSGIEFADSFNFNPHKWMLVNFDCSALWFKNYKYMTDTFKIDASYLKHDKEKVVDYRHWQIPLGRRFRSLKLWFVIRLYGVLGIQTHIRKQIKLAKIFESYIKESQNFYIFYRVVLGLVCFRYKGTNTDNKTLLNAINDQGHIHLVGSMVGDVFILRLAICAESTQTTDIDYAWEVIKKTAESIFEKDDEKQLPYKNEQ